MEPRKFETVADQGDVKIIRHDSLPEGLIPVKAESSDHVIAHSESGHHHAIEADSIDLYRSANDDLSLWAVPRRDTVLRHLRGFDTHDPIALQEGGTYQLIRSREWSPKGWRKAID